VPISTLAWLQALPWVLLEHPDLDWQWLVRAAKVNDLQNKLGFCYECCASSAEMLGRNDTAKLLGDQEKTWNDRLACEETLCPRFSYTSRETLGFDQIDLEEARHWNLLTDLSPGHLSHAL